MITVSGLRFSYDPGFEPEVLKGIDLSIGEGEFVGIVGRNGSGKSSLARALNGLNQPTAGAVSVDGLSTSDTSSLPAIRRKVQLVFQNPENQQVGLTVFEDIAFGLSNFGVPGAQMRERARLSLELVGLAVDLDRDVNTLSGGQLQRLALAGVLALEPSYLVLDEATAMLDPASRSQFLQTLRELRGSTGLSLVHITHHVDEVVDADRLIAIRDGLVEAEGRPAQLIEDEQLLERCGVPPIRQLRRRPSGIPKTTRTIIRTEDLSVAYRRRARRREAGVLALDGLTLSVEEGELLAIAGHSGAGKSTLVATLKGLIKPVSGSISIGGTEPWPTKRFDAFDPIGYAFQFPEHQLFALTVRDDIGYGLRHRRLGTDEHEAKIVNALCRVGLDPAQFLHRSPFELSGGEKRRVALAGVLVSEPSILVLDEPTAGLDYPSRVQLFELIHELRREAVTVIWVSHRFDEIYEHADRVAILGDGRLEVIGDPAVVLAAFARETAP